MDDVTREYLDAVNKIAEPSPTKLADEVVWLEMYKCFVNWHATSRTPITYADAADQALLEFKKRFR